MLAFHSFPLKGGGGPKATSPGLSVLFLAWLGYQGHPPRTSGAWPASKLSAEPHYLLSLNFHSALLSRASVSIWDDPSTVLGATPQPQLDELLHGHPKKLSLHAASSLWLSILWGGGAFRISMWSPQMSTGSGGKGVTLFLPLPGTCHCDKKLLEDVSAQCPCLLLRHVQPKSIPAPCVLEALRKALGLCFSPGRPRDRL